MAASSLQPRLPAIEAPPQRQQPKQAQLLPPEATGRAVQRPTARRGSYSDAHTAAQRKAVGRKGASLTAAASAAALPTGQLGSSWPGGDDLAGSNGVRRRGTGLPPQMPAIAGSVAEMRDRARSIVAGAGLGSMGVGGYAASMHPAPSAQRSTDKWAHVTSRIPAAVSKYVSAAGEEARARAAEREESSKDRLSEGRRISSILSGSAKKWSSLH